MASNREDVSIMQPPQVIRPEIIRPEIEGTGKTGTNRAGTLHSVAT
jgi:hypothetical protein